nr:hypothetical protein [Bacteroides acidifaciens]
MHRKRYLLPWFFCGLLVGGCSSGFKSLHEKRPTVSLSLPLARTVEAPKRELPPDSAQNEPQEFVFTKADGSEVPLNVTAEWDSINKETMTSVALDEVVIAATSSRNTAERDGKINVEFVVTVPVELQKENWMVDVFPILSKGGVEEDSLRELRFTGPEFRQRQERDYQRYDRFLEGIIPDSVNFYRTFVDYHSFERYLDRLYYHKQGLDRIWAHLGAKAKRPHPLWIRYEESERRASRRDSLLRVHSLVKAGKELVRSREEYGEALAALHDTVRYVNPFIRSRFRFFNEKKENLNNVFKTSEKVHRNRFAAELAMEPIQETGMPEELYERFLFFNRKMQENKKKLYYKFREKAARKEGGQSLGAIRAFVAGKDTTNYLNRDQLLKKYTSQYEKVRDFLPMFSYERPMDDSTYLASRRRKEYTPADTTYRPSLAERLLAILPQRKVSRTLPDSIFYEQPSERVRKRFEEARYDSATIYAGFRQWYEKKSGRIKHYDREVVQTRVNKYKERVLKKRAVIGNEVARINSLDTTEIVKRFYDTRKIARNEARKAQKDEKFRDLVRFPYNPDAKLDTVIYSADKVFFLYSEKIAADENTSRLKVFLKGNVVDHSGNKYKLPTVDTLTFFVSSMTKFVDERPRYIQRVVTRDAEASARVNFIFSTGKTRLNREMGDNEKELKRIRELTQTLMTDPIYIIDSLTIYSGSSPEGNWKMNEQLSRERAQSIREVVEKDFKVLYDSLNISMSMMIDEQGNMVSSQAKEELPNLPKLIRVKWVPENWQKLSALIVNDEKIQMRNEILELIQSVKNPDEREYQIRRKYRKDYDYIREKLYPDMRSVDFQFSLHRRGMQKDTMYTRELDRVYMNGVELLKKRKYQEALDVLRPYEDTNTAIAYMSLGYDKAALRIMSRQKESADTKYLQAVLEYRLGHEKQAVLSYMRACELNPQLKFRGNLDPELSTLIKKYGLFKEDEIW